MRLSGFSLVGYCTKPELRHPKDLYPACHHKVGTTSGRLWAINMCTHHADCITRDSYHRGQCSSGQNPATSAHYDHSGRPCKIIFCPLHVLLCPLPDIWVLGLYIHVLVCYFIHSLKKNKKNYILPLCLHLKDWVTDSIVEYKLNSCRFSLCTG